MRFMPWIIGAAFLVGFVTWGLLADANHRDNQHISDDELSRARALVRIGEVPGDDRPWPRQHPALAGLGAGLVVFVVGSVAVIAVNSERRD